MRKRSVVFGVTSLVLMFGLASCNSTVDNPANDLAATREAPSPMVSRTPQPIMEDDVTPSAVPSAAVETPAPPVAPAAVEAPAVAVPEPEPVSVPAPVQTPEPQAAPPVVTKVQVPVPTVQAPAPVSPAVVVPKQEAVTPVEPPRPVATPIYVGLAGGQSVVDLCRGPVLFTPVTQTKMVVEHDGCGGWAQFGNMAAGQLVTLSGNVGGTYKIGGQMVVNKFANSSVIPAGFGGIYPPLIFQTCIPGTNQMVLTAAYPV